VKWLPWAEYCYNTSFQRVIQTSPFKVVYGRDPPSIKSYESGTTKVDTVERTLLDRDEFLQEIMERLILAQNVMKEQHHDHRRELDFQVGDWVWLRLQHRQAANLGVRAHAKLAPRYYGPFQILERIGTVAYRLQLPPSTRIHDVFHVRLLKRFHGTIPKEVPLLPTI
jgi:hypothetical protein